MELYRQMEVQIRKMFERWSSSTTANRGRWMTLLLHLGDMDMVLPQLETLIMCLTKHPLYMLEYRRLRLLRLRLVLIQTTIPPDLLRKRKKNERKRKVVRGVHHHPRHRRIRLGHDEDERYSYINDCRIFVLYFVYNDDFT